MKDYALDLGKRSAAALRIAQRDVDHNDFDSAASRAYYAAFYVVSAFFALEGRTFRKHSAVEAMFHKDLVKPGRVPAHISLDYRSLRLLRDTADYGGLEHVSGEQAAEAIQAAQRIIRAIAQLCPELSKPND